MLASDIPCVRGLFVCLQHLQVLPCSGHSKAFMCHILTLIAPDNERHSESLTVLYINDFGTSNR